MIIVVVVMTGYTVVIVVVVMTGHTVDITVTVMMVIIVVHYGYSLTWCVAEACSAPTPR